MVLGMVVDLDLKGLGRPGVFLRSITFCLKLREVCNCLAKNLNNAFNIFNKQNPNFYSHF